MGGRFPRFSQDCRLDLKASPWFSLEIVESWVFALVISTLEALAVLLSIKLQCWEEPRPCQTKVLIARSLTDSRGSGVVLNKLRTAKFPASAVLVELAAYMNKMSLSTVVEWAEGDREADTSKTSTRRLESW